MRRERRVAAHRPAAPHDAASYDADADAGATPPSASAAAAARGTAAAFLTAWVNCEATGALASHASWSSVLEPNRCLIRSLFPRFLACLPVPCLWLSTVGPSAPTTAAFPAQAASSSSRVGIPGLEAPPSAMRARPAAAAESYYDDGRGLRPFEWSVGSLCNAVGGFLCRSLGFSGRQAA